MSDIDRDGRDLWRRYGAAALASAPGAEPDAEPDWGPLATWLAPYLEGELNEAAAAPIEAWLARHPEALALVAPLAVEVGPAPLDLVRRARALVQPRVGGAAVRPTWRHGVAWASIAASLLLVGATGFMAGHAAVDHGEAVATLMGGELIFGPGGGDGDGAAF
jgi:hypothetical protein